ncbi:S-layer homology domain-containing protein [Candidatus Peregrinibacteria bacterium]|nr:MAG: S-layer homology domain-containing protein [Candidatus Peregrinibacteria bacterium]
MTDCEQLLDFCRRQIGKPYLLSSEGPEAFDCSGLLLAGLSVLRVSDIPRLSTDQYTLGTPIVQEDIRQGDLLFFDTGWTNRVPNHCGVAINPTEMINANSVSGVTKESFLAPYWKPKYTGARRIFDKNGKVLLSKNDSQKTESQFFIDVPQDHPFWSCIEELRKKDLVHGYAGNLFRPDQEVMRSEALKILLLAFDIPISPELSSSPFSDVFPQDWHFSIVNTAYKRGIIQGNPDGIFCPNRSVNRAEMCKMIFLSANISPPSISSSAFSDVPKNAWFAPFVAEAGKRNLFLISGGKFFPEKPVTRAEMCRCISFFWKSA